MIINKILVSFGILLMIWSIFLCKHIISTINRKESRKSWSLLFFFICFFLAGYIAYLFLIIFSSVETLLNNVLVSAIFFFGALFVVLVLRTSLVLLEKLMESDDVLTAANIQLIKATRQLRTRENQLQRAKKELELKNKKLEETLEDFYTLRIGMEKEIEEGVFTKENQRIKEMLDLLKKR